MEYIQYFRKLEIDAASREHLVSCRIINEHAHAYFALSLSFQNEFFFFSKHQHSPDRFAITRELLRKCKLVNSVEERARRENFLRSPTREIVPRSLTFPQEKKEKAISLAAQ